MGILFLVTVGYRTIFDGTKNSTSLGGTGSPFDCLGIAW